MVVELTPTGTSRTLDLSPGQLDLLIHKLGRQTMYHKGSWGEIIRIHFQDLSGKEHAPCGHTPNDRHQAHIMNVKLGRALLDVTASKLKVFFQLICPGEEGNEHLNGPMQLLFEFLPTKEHLDKLLIKCRSHFSASDTNRRESLKTKQTKPPKAAERSQQTEKRPNLQPKSYRSPAKRQKPNPTALAQEQPDPALQMPSIPSPNTPFDEANEEDLVMSISV